MPGFGTGILFGVDVELPLNDTDWISPDSKKLPTVPETHILYLYVGPWKYKINFVKQRDIFSCHDM